MVTLNNAVLTALHAGGVSRSMDARLSDVVSVKDFGATGDGTTDDLAAFDAAHDYFGATSKGGTIIIPAGDYSLSDTWHIDKRLTIIGAHPGFQTDTAGTRLKFPANTTGIRIYSGTATGETAAPSANSGTKTSIKGILLYCTSKQTTGHGIHASAIVYLDQINVDSFAENGINIVASAALNLGNANQWTIMNSRVKNNGGHGLYVQGQDVNAGVAINLDCSSNGGWGFYDSSLLGNTYIACHCIDNAIGTYKTTGGVAENIFIGCYAESAGQSGTEFVSPTMVIGGVLSTTKQAPTITISGDGTGALASAITASGVISAIQMTNFGSGYTTATATASGGSGSGASLTPVVSGGKVTSITIANGGSNFPESGARLVNIRHAGSSGGMRTGRVESTLSRHSSRSGNVTLSDGTDHLISAQVLGDNVSGFQPLKWNESRLCFETRHANNSARAGIRWATDLSTGETGGRSAALTGGSVLFPYGFWIGETSNSRQQTNGTAAPVAGEWARGDIVWNRAPSAGGTVGWICTTAGTPGTWKIFGGTIEP